MANTQADGAETGAIRPLTPDAAATLTPDAAATLGRIASGIFSYRGWLIAGSRGDWTIQRDATGAEQYGGYATRDAALAAIDHVYTTQNAAERETTRQRRERATGISK